MSTSHINICGLVTSTALKPMHAGRLEVFLYLRWWLFYFVSIPELFGMAGGPRSRRLGVDSGPGRGGSEGVRGAPEPYKNIYVYRRPDVHYV